MGKTDISKDNIITTSPIVVDNEINNKYIEKLDKLLKNDDCKNIALLGNYGSGKSSLLKTYFKKRQEIYERSLTITIGSYIVDKDINTDNVIDSHEQILVNRVEESILKQIIYRKKFSLFPKSSLIRYDKESIFKKIAYVFILIYSIWFAIFYYFKYFKNKIIDFNKLYNFFGIFGLIMFGILLFLGYKLVNTIINKVKINKIKVKDCEMDLHQDTNSLFSRYLSEIVYYFQITKYNVIVFEDLDRFPNDIALKVIQELKELNTILNNVHNLEKIVFIYAVKDSLFNKVEDKNKFYDYNLSLLPISTAFNSEINLVGLLKQQNVYEDLSTKIISVTAKYISDMRTLINIVNDYCLFKQITKTKNCDKLFAMVVFKNHYFKEYNELETESDLIKKSFDSVEQKRKEIIEALNNKKSDIIKAITEIETDTIKSKLELKQLLLSYNASRTGYDARPITHYYIEGNALEISNFLSEDYDIDELENNKFEFKRYDTRINEKQVFEKFGSKKEFVTRFKNVGNLTKIQELNKAKIEMEKEINKIKESNPNDIFKKYFNFTDLENEEFKDKKLLYELIQKGFICKDYMDYITSPTIYGDGDDEESLMYSDSEFLMNVRQERYSLDTEIKGFKTVINMLKEDFDSPFILNYNLLNYLIDTGQELYINKIFKQFEQSDDVKVKFLINFCKKHSDKIKFVFDKLIEQKCDIWGAYITNDELLTIEDGNYLLEKILLETNYLKMIKDISSMRIFLETKLLKTEDEINQLLIGPKVRENILKIKPRFKNIEILNEENFNFVYQNNLYSFEENNIYRILDTKSIDFQQISNNSKYELLYKNIKQNIDLFCEEYYIFHNENFCVQVLIDCILNSETLKISIKKEIFKREKFKIRSINDIPEELYEELILYDHLYISWKNIIDLYKKVNNTLLFEYVNKNSSKLLNRTLPDGNEKTIDSFFKKYVLYLLKSDLNLAENMIQISYPVYEQINDLSKEEISLLIKYNCVSFNKYNYKFIVRYLSKEERYLYVLNYYNSKKGLTEIINTILLEDLELLLLNKDINNNQKLELLYGIYKKEKRKSQDEATAKFIERLKFSFSENKNYTLTYNSTIYNAIIRKLKQLGVFKMIEINNSNIEFKL